MPPDNAVDRRDFLKHGAAAAAAAAAVATTGVGSRFLFAGESGQAAPAQKTPARPKTNIDDVLKIPRTKTSLPGPYPGRVVEVFDPAAMPEGKVNGDAVKAMFEKGISALTGKSPKESFGLFFSKDDIVGLKVNPVGPGLISTRLELVDAVGAWLEAGGIPRKNIVIWDRFDYMLTDAGFTAERFPGFTIEGMQTMDEAAAEAAMKKQDADNSKWLKPDGTHISVPNFDLETFYWVDVEGPKDLAYLNQHVFNGKHSYFGKLLTKKLTKFINLPVFKNTGHAISMATKNIGYGAICNTNRLHQPLFLDVCVEPLAFPDIRDKMVLNVTDGLRCQYDGGPGPNAKFAYIDNKIYLATDPFALDMVCHNLLVAKRKEMGAPVNENPRNTEYLRYAEKLGLGVVAADKLTHIKV
ncbi:MAG: DUF362 domain-containing protein [Candidatus Aminicenantes bacterium]|nr:DUF362 domain-containing protein [Candidatus Aminicenantes bacterium]